MTITRQSSGGVRQKIWDRLRKGRSETGPEIAAAIGANPVSVRQYIGALAERGYVRHDEAGYVNGGLQRPVTLTRNTGPRAPSWSVHTGEFRDWNTDPAMSGKALGNAIKASGLSLPEWLRQHGFSATGAARARLKEMINGARPVSGAVANAAKNSN